MRNKSYWDGFYKRDLAPKDPSNFAKFTMPFLKRDDKLVDIACGNGRDSAFFIANEIKTDSIDLSYSGNMNINFIKSDMMTFDYSGYDVLYLRFVLHTITENELDLLLDIIQKTAKKSKIFIETRSTKGITDEEKSETYFKSSIGDEHFRMLYSEEYLTKKMKKFFEVNFVVEGQNFAEYNGENPYCIRYILSND